MFKRALFSTLATPFLAGICLCQTAAAPAFEVASIKPSPLDITQLAQEVAKSGQIPKLGARVDAARAEYIFMSLKDLIGEAYKVKPFQITGPDWLDKQRFDIAAKMPAGAKVDDAPQMLQALLAERFKVVVRRETKDRNVMALVAGKGGPKLQEAPPDSAPVDENAPPKPGEQIIDTPEGKVRMARGPNNSFSFDLGKRGRWMLQVGANQTLHMEASKTTMSAFADMLTQFNTMLGGGGAQVVDMTGLTGNYQVALDFSLTDLLAIARSAGLAVPDMAGGMAGGGGRGAPAETASDPTGTSSLHQAVQNLGLKLEQRKAPTEQLIVESAEKMPTEN